MRSIWLGRIKRQWSQERFVVQQCQRLFQVDQGCHSTRLFLESQMPIIKLVSNVCGSLCKHMMEGPFATQDRWLPQKLTPEFLVSSNIAMIWFTSRLGCFSVRMVLLYLPEMLERKKNIIDQFVVRYKGSSELLIPKCVSCLQILKKQSKHSNKQTQPNQDPPPKKKIQPNPNQKPNNNLHTQSKPNNKTKVNQRMTLYSLLFFFKVLSSGAFFSEHSHSLGTVDAEESVEYNQSINKSPLLRSLECQHSLSLRLFCLVPY